MFSFLLEVKDSLAKINGSYQESLAHPEHRINLLLIWWFLSEFWKGFISIDPGHGDFRFLWPFFPFISGNQSILTNCPKKKRFDRWFLGTAVRNMKSNDRIERVTDGKPRDELTLCWKHSVSLFISFFSLLNFLPMEDETLTFFSAQHRKFIDLRDCHYISVLDANSFFCQRRIHPEDRYKLTIVTHRGQETFLIPVMGCRNSMAYVQRQMIRIFRQGLYRRHYPKVQDVLWPCPPSPHYIPTLFQA